MNTAVPKLFISYRREESAGHAGRIYDAVAERFGDDGIFMDVTLAPGIDFVQQIERAVGNCHVLLAVIGPRWATVSQGNGPRLAEADDFVGLEVSTALQRDDVLVVPVLVGGARMPDPDHLPARLRRLTRLQALELSDQRWRYDLGRLMNVLQARLHDATGLHPATPVPSPAPRPSRPPATVGSAPLGGTTTVVLGGVAVAAVVGLLVQLAIGPLNGPEVDVSHGNFVAGQIAANLGRRAITWAALGAALGAWLLYARDERTGIGGAALTGALVGALAGLLGGLVFALPGFLFEWTSRQELSPPDANLGLPHASQAIRIASVTLSATIVGCLLGSLWRARRPGSGLLLGLAGGALIQAFVVLSLRPDLLEQYSRDTTDVIQGVVQATVFTAIVLGGLAALDHVAASVASPRVRDG